MSKAKRWSRSIISLTLSAVLCTSGVAGIGVPVRAAAGNTDLAREAGVITMVDCPIIRKSELKNNPALKINDGNDTTGWTSGSKDSVKHEQHWAYVDLGSPKTFDQIQMVWDSGKYAKDYTIQVSNTARDSDWHERAKIKGNTSGGKKTHDLKEQTTAQYVRVYIDKAAALDAVVTLNTISVYQKKVAAADNASVEKDFAWLTENQIKSAGSLYPELTNKNLKNVKASLNLPKSGFGSSDIEWSVEPDNGNINLDSGEVIRGKEDESFTLTAKVSKGSVSKTKTFDVTIKANMVTGAELVKGETHNYLTANGKPLPYIAVQNCGYQQNLGNSFGDGGFQTPLPLSWTENLFEKTADLNFKRIGVIFKWRDFEVSEGVYNWDIVDKYIEWCDKYDMYWDIVYFGSNSCGGSRIKDGGVSGTEAWSMNVPAYVGKYTGYFDNGVHPGAPMNKCPVLKGPNADWIKKNEIRAVQALMNHIAEKDKNHRTACFQVMNEPYWHEMSQPYWRENWNPKNNGEDRWIYDWISDFAVAIKASDYSLPTRINGSTGAYNRDQYTWLNNLPGIDMVGDDSYNTGLKHITNIFKDDLGNSAFPHVAENNGGFGNTSSLVLTTILNGGGHHSWQLSPHAGGQSMSANSHLNWELGKPETAVWNESGRDMARLNKSINRISEMAAVAALNKMTGFNLENDSPAGNYKKISKVGGSFAGYECDDASVAMAIQDTGAVYLVSDSASTGDGKVNFITNQVPGNISYGEFDEDGKWVVEETLIAVKGMDGNYRVPFKEGKCIRAELEILPVIEKLTLSAGAPEIDFDMDIHEYGFDVGSEMKEIRLTATLDDENGQYMVNGFKYRSGKTSMPIPLQFGETKIVVELICEGLPSNESNSYTITVNREAKEDITAKEVADSLREIPKLLAVQKQITYPRVPEGFEISIASSSMENIVSLDGSVTPDELDRVVKLAFQVKKGTEVAVSKALPLKVTAKTDTPQNVNLCLRKPIIDMTHGQSWEVGSNAVDGNYATRYVASSAGFPASLTIDLEEIMEFNQLVLTWDAAGANEYSLFVSDDNKNWTKVFDETQGNQGTMLHNFSEMYHGRYVKLNPTKNGPSANIFALVEMELYNRNLMSEDDVLRDITLSAGILTPEFDTNVTSYTAVVGTETESIILTPKQNGAEASVKINDIVVQNGQSSEVIPLQEGENRITVFVQDANKEDCTATYEIVVTKKDFPVEEYGNVLLNKPITPIGAGDFNWPLNNCNDGDFATFSQNKSGNADYQFDLEGTFLVEQFQMHSSTNAPTNFEVKVSLDGTNWTTVQKVTGFTPVTGIYDFEPINARYVLVDCAPRAWLAINEMVMNGAKVDFNAKAIADNIKNLTAAAGDVTLELPVVPAEYEVRIKSSSNPEAIDLEGNITQSDIYQNVDIVLEVVNIDDNTDTADTKPIQVSVQPNTLTCQNVLDDLVVQVPEIQKNQTSLKLPEAPAGFDVSYTFGDQGDRSLMSIEGNLATIHPKREDGTVTYTMTVSRAGENSASYWYIFEIPGRLATAEETIEELLIETSQRCGGALEVPNVSEEYKLELISTSNSKVINLVGTITEIESTTKVNLVLKVTRLRDNTTALRTVTITVLSNADFSELKNLVEASEALLEARDRDNKEFRHFCETLIEAKRVLDESSSINEDIKAACDALIPAKADMEKRDELEVNILEIVEEAEKRNEADYTEDTWAKLEKALITARELLLADEMNEQQANNAIQNLRKAIDDLELKDTTPPVTTYKIDYQLNGGTNHSNNPETYTKDSAFTFQNPTRAGYTFLGWYKDSTFKTKITAIKKGMSGDITIYAKWKENKSEVKPPENPVTSYKINYQLNGGTNHSKNPATYTEDSTFTFQSPTRTGFTFLGWYRDSTFMTKIIAIEKGMSGDITVYAKWEENKSEEKPVTYKVTFNKNGGSRVTKSSITVTQGKTYGILPTAYRKGYTFKGWYTAKTKGSKITSKSKVNLTKNQTLYAQWTKVEKPAKAIISSAKSNKSGQMLVELKKIKGVSGYEIKFSTNSKFKSAKTIRTSSLMKEIKLLEKGKTYYVKVRAYKVDSTNKRIYGSYSNTKQVKIKK